MIVVRESFTEALQVQPRPMPHPVGALQQCPSTNPVCDLAGAWRVAVVPPSVQKWHALSTMRLTCQPSSQGHLCGPSPFRWTTTLPLVRYTHVRACVLLGFSFGSTIALRAGANCVHPGSLTHYYDIEWENPQVTFGGVSKDQVDSPLLLSMPPPQQAALASVASVPVHSGGKPRILLFQYHKHGKTGALVSITQGQS